MLRPTGDPFLLQLNISKTDLLEEKSYPTFLYYNPATSEQSVSVDVGHAPADLYDLQTHRIVGHAVVGTTELRVPAGKARVIVQLPSGLKRTVAGRVVRYGGVSVDYRVRS